MISLWRLLDLENKSRPWECVCLYHERWVYLSRVNWPQQHCQTYIILITLMFQVYPTPSKERSVPLDYYMGAARKELNVNFYQQFKANSGCVYSNEGIWKRHVWIAECECVPHRSIGLELAFKHCCGFWNKFALEDSASANRSCAV